MVALLLEVRGHLPFSKWMMYACQTLFHLPFKTTQTGVQYIPHFLIWKQTHLNAPPFMPWTLIDKEPQYFNCHQIYPITTLKSQFNICSIWLLQFGWIQSVLLMMYSTGRDVATVVGSGRQQPPLDPADHHSALKPPLPTTTKIYFFFFFFANGQKSLANGQTWLATTLITTIEVIECIKMSFCCRKHPRWSKLRPPLKQFLATTQNS